MKDWKDPNKWVTQVETLEAENKRLREALDMMLNNPDLADIPKIKKLLHVQGSGDD